MSHASPDEKKWILVIDSQETMRDILERFLNADGYFVSTAADADEGVAKARSLPLSLVILDLDLPFSGGLCALAELKGSPATEHLPLLLISSKFHERDLRGLARPGRDGYLTMPFSYTEVHDSVSDLLGLDERKADDSRKHKTIDKP